MREYCFSVPVSKKTLAIHICTLISMIAWGVSCATEKPQDAQIESVLVTGHASKVFNGTGDAAAVLSNQGVDFSSAGGVSSLPVLQGFNDDRIKVLIDGAEITSACANHMNPPLSYIDASRLQSVEVIAGIVPVSAGGDSIGGTIKIASEMPAYAETKGPLLKMGSAGYFYRSNNHNHGLALGAGLASNWASLVYSGSMDKADSYKDGNGDTVLDTLYKSESHNVTLGMRGEQQEMILKLTHQKIPYQGFPNQYMDMVDNTSYGINLHYLRQFNWGQLDSRLTWQNVDHEMVFFTDEKPGTMPMITQGRDIGFKISAEIPYLENSSLALGSEYHQFTLDDRWPSVEGSMMMGPNNYVNINNGERTRVALYAESAHSFFKKWQALFGVRYEHVVMDTGDVQPYNTTPSMMNADAPAAAEFNAQSRRRADDNFDLSNSLRYVVDEKLSLEIGYGRKTRSPNLYERYSWGRGTMAMTMIGWFGDGNGYVGDVDLAPEIAHTLSATGKWSQDDNNLLSVTPYYTRVDDFIDAQQIGSFNPRMAMSVTRPLLQFTNINASLYGAQLHARKQLIEGSKNTTVMDVRLAYTKGERSEDDSSLYHIMPLNIRMAMEHALHAWTNRLELQWVDSKESVDDLRLEPTTASYTLVNISTAYQWRKILISASVNNLADRQYQLALGGAYLSGWLAGDKMAQFESLPGQGRSLNFGLRYEF